MIHKPQTTPAPFVEDLGEEGAKERGRMREEREVEKERGGERVKERETVGTEGEKERGKRRWRWGK